MTIKPYLTPLYALSVAALLSGCQSDSGSGSDGSLSVGLTDAPIDEAQHVYVSIKGLSLNHEGEGWVDYNFDNVQRVDLLSLQSGNTLSLVENITVPSGNYKVRLNLATDDGDAIPEHAIVLTDGTEYSITIPSGYQTGLKLTSDISVLANGSASYTIDFDVRKSIVQTSSTSYKLKPVLHVVDNADVGSISGSIETSALTAGTCSDADPDTYNAVYVFKGSNVTPDDIGSSGAQAVATTPVEYDSGTGQYQYKSAFLQEGDYTVAFSCSANLEDTETDDELNFVTLGNYTVTAGN
ncbi:MAG: DUF4382 domain-containing protein [Hydrogenovibrio crunogenus]|nr:DUF4382 domain-containing protein [Hydrogenovibrio crunogenus]